MRCALIQLVGYNDVLDFFFADLGVAKPRDALGDTRTQIGVVAVGVDLDVGGFSVVPNTPCDVYLCTSVAVLIFLGGTQYAVF